MISHFKFNCSVTTVTIYAGYCVSTSTRDVLNVLSDELPPTLGTYPEANFDIFAKYVEDVIFAVNHTSSFCH